MKDLIVIGGGVAGLMAAGTAAGLGLDVLLLEKMEKPARKLRITGKGRCNLTNVRPIDEFLSKVPQGADFIKESLQGFDNQTVIAFFEKLGLPLTIERGGRVFPTSSRAWDVADTLISWNRRQGVEICCNSTVTDIERISIEARDLEPTVGIDLEGAELTANVAQTIVSERYGDGFRISIDGQASVECRRLLITTGGVSYPATGSTGDGYQFAFDMGHSIVPLRPALVPLQIANVSQYNKLALKNIKLALLIDGVQVDERFGDVEFTDRALGGAIVLQISRLAVDAIISKQRVEVSLDLKSALSPTKLHNRIDREIEAMPTADFRVLLQKLTPSPLFTRIAEQSGVPLKQTINSLASNDIDRIVTTLKSLIFPVIDYRPFTEAIITAGGVDLAQINPKTMESLVVSGLFFAGEVLDIDADTGGFNIQLALSTAVAAAKAISTT